MMPENTQLVVLVYAPHLRTHPLATSSKPRTALHRSSSGGSSYSDISTLDAQATDNPSPSNKIANPYNPLYEALNSQAQELVDHATQILPFTTPTGHIHLLRHLSPSTVYLQEALAGDFGENVEQINGWVGQVVLLIDGGSIGRGLVDTETEGEDVGQKGDKRQGQKWWMDENRVGLGKGIEVVESGKFADDWARRVSR